MKHRKNSMRGVGPASTRPCGKCGKQTDHICSGKFRVNANGKCLDVWLIYRCERCNNLWNMPIYSRVKPQSIPTELYQAFLENDEEVALEYARAQAQARGRR